MDETKSQEHDDTKRPSGSVIKQFGKYCDLKLESTDNGFIICHREFVQAMSSYFKTLFESHFKENIRGEDELYHVKTNMNSQDLYTFVKLIYCHMFSDQVCNHYYEIDPISLHHFTATLFNEMTYLGFKLSCCYPTYAWSKYEVFQHMASISHDINPDFEWDEWMSNHKCIQNEPGWHRIPNNTIMEYIISQGETQIPMSVAGVKALLKRKSDIFLDDFWYLLIWANLLGFKTRYKGLTIEGWQLKNIDYTTFHNGARVSFRIGGVKKMGTILDDVFREGDRYYVVKLDGDIGNTFLKHSDIDQTEPEKQEFIMGLVREYFPKYTSNLISDSEKEEYEKEEYEESDEDEDDMAVMFKDILFDHQSNINSSTSLLNIGNDRIFRYCVGAKCELSKGDLPGWIFCILTMNTY